VAVSTECRAIITSGINKDRRREVRQGGSAAALANALFFRDEARRG
jgi:hypothetical protein